MSVEGQQYKFSHPNHGNYKKTRLLNCLRFQLTRDQKESVECMPVSRCFFFLTSAFVIQTAQEWGWGSVSLLASLLELNDRRVSSVSLCARRGIRYNVVIDNFVWVRTLIFYYHGHDYFSQYRLHLSHLLPPPSLVLNFHT